MFGGTRIVVFFFIRKQKASMFKQAFAIRIAREKELYLSCENLYKGTSAVNSGFDIIFQEY